MPAEPGIRRGLGAACLVALLAAPAAPAHAAESAVPTDSEALFQFLKSGAYKGWGRESSAHPSAGPHPVRVKVFFNPVLEASMKAGAQVHPPGAASVKELYDAEGRISGWAASVKVGTGQTGESWYWYEVLSTTDGSSPVAAKRGVPLCFGCHMPGQDFVLTRHPLR